jgi:hypothetical protein
LSDASRVAIIVVYVIFVIVINAPTAIRRLPLVFAGIRLGMGRAIKGMINGEMLIAFVGLGALAQRYGAQFDAAKVLLLRWLSL